MGRVDGIYGGAYEGRAFVLTHDPPAESANPRIEFVTGPIEDALAAAQEAAAERDVGIFGGSLTAQCLRAGLLDELVLHFAPVLLGDGVPLLRGLEGAGPIELERLS